MASVTAFTADALGDMDAVGVADAIRSGQVSSEEIFDAAVTRSAAVDSQLNAVAFDATATARRRSTATSSGFFAGVPTFIKDMVQVAGMPTGQGSDAWAPRPAKRDGAFVRQFRHLGVNPIGISTMSEFGLNAVAEHPRRGPVCNPWNTEHTAGGSSSGSAALVASGVVPFAHAVDGGGSIRIPASCCGLVGLKPSRGRLPLDNDLRFIPIQIASNGVLTRTVRDTAAFYREMELIHRPRSLEPIGDVTGPDRRRLVIAVATRSPLGECSPEVRDEIRRVAGELDKAGHRIVELDTTPVPPTFVDDFMKYYSLVAFAAERLGRVRFSRSFDPSKVDAFTHGLTLRARNELASIPGSIARLRRTHEFSARQYQEYDILMTPTVAQPPPLVGVLGPTETPFDQLMARVSTWASFTPLQNITGEPSISLPTGMSSTGLPIGTLLSAATGKEAMLLSLAYELDELRPSPRLSNTAGTDHQS